MFDRKRYYTNNSCFRYPGAFDSGQFKSAVGTREHLCEMKLYAFESGKNQFYERLAHYSIGGKSLYTYTVCTRKATI